MRIRLTCNLKGQGLGGMDSLYPDLSEWFFVAVEADDNILNALIVFFGTAQSSTQKAGAV